MFGKKYKSEKAMMKIPKVATPYINSVPVSGTLMTLYFDKDKRAS